MEIGILYIRFSRVDINFYFSQPILPINFKVEDKKFAIIEKGQNFNKNTISDEEKKRNDLKYQMAFDLQEKDIKV